MTLWYYVDKGEQRGPLNEEDFKVLISKGVVSASTLVWKPGMDSWTPASLLPGIFLPPPLPTASVDPPPLPAQTYMPRGLQKTPQVETSLARENVSSETKTHSYIRRHWRGELSLPTSYLLNCLGLSILVILSTTWIGNQIERVSDAKLVGLWCIGFWVLAFVIWLWQIVGTWRCASNYSLRHNRWWGSWGDVVKALLFLGILGGGVRFLSTGIPQMKEGFRLISSSTRDAKYEIRILNQGREAEISGGIFYGLTEELKKHLDANKAIWLIHLNSTGGRIAEAKRLHDLLKERGLAVYTSKQCLSACAFAFLGGERHYRQANAKLGFHSPSFVGVDEHELDVSGLKQMMLNDGVSASFISKVFTTSSDTMWYPRDDELAQAGIVIQATNGDSFAASEFSALKNTTDLEQELLKIPLCKVYKDVASDDFEQLVAGMHILVLPRFD